MLSQGQAQKIMLDKLPTGFAWTSDPNSNWGRLFTPPAAEQVLFEQAAEAMLPEATPSTATQMISDYERVLGPDPCLGPTIATLEERRKSAHMRWTETGGASRARFITLAANLGYAITIDEFRPPRAGQMRVGDRCYDRLVAFTWRVNAPATEVVPWRAGVSRVGDKINTAGIPWLACNLQRRSPAHTTLIIAYAGTPVTDDQGDAVTDDEGRVVTGEPSA